MKIGYLGPPGSFSHEAASKFARASRCARASDLVPFSSFDLIQALRAGDVQKVLLPIENSNDGSINWVFSLLSGNNFHFLIEGEIVLSIRHCLIGFGETSDVKVIYSRSQALAQCRKILDKLRVKTVDTDSTSEAVELIAKEKDPQKAAIGTKRAASLYQAGIIKSNIQDDPGNESRFIVLGTKPKKRTGNDKTSFVFGTENKPGALFRVLEVFDVLGINMSMIHSRPSENKKLGEYAFFIDVEAHQRDESLRITFQRIQQRVSFLRILGSYPKAKKESPKKQ